MVEERDQGVPAVRSAVPSAWQIDDAYVASVAKLEDVFTSDDGPVWEASIECSQGWEQAATVCGGSEREARVRGEAVARALRGEPMPLDHMNHVERLYRSDNEDDWITAEVLQVLAALAAQAIEADAPEGGSHD